MSVPENSAFDILNWLVTMSVMLMADIGVHNNWRVNNEPAINAANITNPQPVKKNCHRRFNRLCLKKIIKLRLSPCTGHSVARH